ncbi:hypothetical protein V6N13_064874 [Hibiscus sabdariffa]
MSFDFSENPIFGQLLSPTGRSPDLSSGGMCTNGASEVNGTTGHDSRDMRGLPVDAGNHPSFRDMVTGRTATAPHDNIISALDVELQADDVLINLDGAFPEIRFSDRIHKEIDAKLSKSVIVRLLGKSIGYRALKNRVHAHWNPSGELSIIDLDNDYYLIQFAMDAHYVRVLSDDPWMSYFLI